MDDFDTVISRYGGSNFCQLPAQKQAEYMGLVAQRGVYHALKAVGLSDAEAAEDIRDIRDLLRGLRVVRKAAWATMLSAMGRALGWAAIIAVAALFMRDKSAHEITSLLNP
jgi:hypothetical protein